MYINYKTLHIIKVCSIIAYPIATIICFVVPTGGSLWLRILPTLIMWIGIELTAVLLRLLVRCPKCNSRKITLSYSQSQLKPGTVIYCPECGQQIELLDPTDPRLKKKS